MLAAHRTVASAQAELLSALAELGKIEDGWEDEGAHDAAHAVSMHLQVSHWKATSWIETGRALEGLPAIRAAFVRGELSLYAVMELARFATSEEDDAIAAWATKSSMAQVRKAAERACATAEEAIGAREDRFCEYGYSHEGARFWLHAELPGPDGAQVAARLDAIAADVPVLPDEPHPSLGHDAAMGTRRADALVFVCQATAHPRGTATDEPQPGSAAVPTVVVHTSLEDVLELERDSHIEGGPSICRETLERFLCDGRIKPQLADRAGNLLDVGRARRQPSRALPSGAPPRRWLRLPRLFAPALDASTPHHVVVQGWANRPGQPRTHLRLPPHVGPRARLGHPARGRWVVRMVPTRRHQVSSRAGGGVRSGSLHG
jgi:hypothetical protein